ncbi:MAG TPA: aldo/keto reductase [Clostridia bacterium]|nr:aldo/keto reductase [Clostridia bacterium]
MKTHRINRRQFLENTALAAGAVMLSSCAGPGLRAGRKRTAADQVVLGKTGLKISRLGFGTGSNSGNVQHELGQENFNRLIRYAYDQGITYFDCAQSYRTFEWVKGAIKGLPRERLFIQSKIGGKPENILQAIDNHRKIFDTDYVDSMLIHCMVKDQWTDEYKRIMDAYDEAKQKRWILSKGVSCHSLPALRAATASQWTEVHLVRVNPQGRYIDGPEQTWNKSGHDVGPVLQEIQTMHADGRGIIGMKIIGNGDFTDPEDRERSIRFAMSRPELHSVVIGFKNTAEIDEAIQRINSALAEAA